MHADLEKLLNIALEDGIFSEKEREILFRKAEKLGVDIDEFEMELEGRLSKIKPNNQQTQNKTTLETMKCPNCGSEIPSFSIKCEYCGFEIKNIKANNSITKLFEMLNEVERQREKKGALKSFFDTEATDNTDKQKLEIISSFPIPTTKDDILEFLSLAIPKAKVPNFLMSMTDECLKEKPYAVVWKAKCEQIIMKARFSFNEDKKTLQMIEQYAKQIKMK